MKHVKMEKNKNKVPSAGRLISLPALHSKHVHFLVLSVGRTRHGGVVLHAEWTVASLQACVQSTARFVRRFFRKIQTLDTTAIADIFMLLHMHACTGMHAFSHAFSVSLNTYLEAHVLEFYVCS